MHVVSSGHLDLSLRHDLCCVQNFIKKLTSSEWQRKNGQNAASLSRIQQVKKFSPCHESVNIYICFCTDGLHLPHNPCSNTINPVYCGNICSEYATWTPPVAFLLSAQVLQDDGILVRVHLHQIVSSEPWLDCTTRHVSDNYVEYKWFPSAKIWYDFFSGNRNMFFNDAPFVYQVHRCSKSD